MNCDPLNTIILNEPALLAHVKLPSTLTKPRRSSKGKKIKKGTRSTCQDRRNTAPINDLLGTSSCQPTDILSSYYNPEVCQPSSIPICVKLPIRTFPSPAKGRGIHNDPPTGNIRIQYSATRPDDRFSSLINPVSTEADPLVTHLVDFCQIKLGPGCQVLELNTEFEPGRVLVLGNLPRDFDEAKLGSFVGKFGKVESIALRSPSSTSHSSIGLIHFKSPACAMQAVHHLDGHHLAEMQLFACLRNNSSRSGEQLNNSVKAVWKAPSICAHAKYDTFEEACDALRRLDETVVLGRRLNASHHLSDHASKGFTLRIEGLPPTASMADVIKALGCHHVSLSHCNYTSLEASLDLVRSLLEKKAPLDQFEVIETFSSGQNVIVKAIYFRPSDAIETRARLHGRRICELGGASLRIHYNQLLSSRVHMKIFEAVEVHLKNLKVKAGSGRTPVALRWSPSKADRESICLFLEGEHLPAVASVKFELESILEGQPILSLDGLPLWHQFFAQPSGLSFLSDCHSSTGTLIWCDPKTRSLRMFGTQIARQEATRFIQEKLKELRQDTKLLALRTRSLPYLLKQGGLARLQKQYGTDVVRMDILRKLLIIHGNPAAARAAGLEIHNGIHLYHTPHRSRLTQKCPVCGEQLQEPVALSCGHSYCRDCLCHLLASAQDASSFPIRCLGDDGSCKSLLSLHVIRALLTPEENTALVRNAFSSYVLSHAKELHYCPTPSCSQLYRSSEIANPPPLQCPSCLRFICTYCHADHIGVDCRTWREEHDEAFSLWRIAHDAKSCPNCKVTIERVEGCNHLACLCGTHICWQCLKGFREGSSVYQHMFKEHGGIGLG